MINFDPQVGHEQSRRRPALVLSPEEYHRKVGLVVLCPATSHAKGYSFEVAIPPGECVQGVILADQVKSFDLWARRAEIIGPCPPDVVRRTKQMIGALLDFDISAL